MSIYKVWSHIEQCWLDEKYQVSLLPTGEAMVGDFNNPSSLRKIAKSNVFFNSRMVDKNECGVYDHSIIRIWKEDEYIPCRDSGGGIIDYNCEPGWSQVGLVKFENGSFNYYTKKEQHFVNGKLEFKDELNEHNDINGVPIEYVLSDGFEVICHLVENPTIFD